MASRIWASTKWPMRTLAITGMLTAVHDRADHARVGHPGHSAVGANIGRHPLQGHHGHRAGLRGDTGLVGGHHVHDDAALEHLGVASLYGVCAC